jgi:hypothetical protein
MKSRKKWKCSKARPTVVWSLLVLVCKKKAFGLKMAIFKVLRAEANYCPKGWSIFEVGVMIFDGKLLELLLVVI